MVDPAADWLGVVLLSDVGVDQPGLPALRRYEGFVDGIRLEVGCDSIEFAWGPQVDICGNT